MEREIQSKLSGIDDILSKALKGMNIQSSSKAVDDIIKENKAIKKEEKQKEQDINNDKLFVKDLPIGNFSLNISDFQK